MFCFLTPLAGVKGFFFFFPVHLCSSLQGTLCNLYSLLFFLIIIEDNVSFRLEGGTWDDLHLVLFYVKFFFFGLFLVIFVFVLVFSPIFHKKKKKKPCCFNKSFKSKFFMLLLSKKFHCFSCSTSMHMHFSHMNMFLGWEIEMTLKILKIKCRDYNPREFLSHSFF